MGLITKEVEVELSGTNIKRLEDLGYEIPRYEDSKGRINVKKGTKIMVKVEDLPNTSDVMVSVKCDECGKILENIEWRSYIKYIKKDGNYYCKYSKPPKNKRKIRKNYIRGLSFYDWCYANLPKEMA